MTRRGARLRALAVGVVACIALLAARARGDGPELVVLLDVQDGVGSMHGALAGSAPEALRAIRGAMPRGVRVMRRAALGAPLAACQLEEPACSGAIERALGGARVVVVRVATTRGPCVPMAGGGHRMLRATEILAGPLGAASPSRSYVAPGTTEDEILERLAAAAQIAVEQISVETSPPDPTPDP